MRLSLRLVEKWRAFSPRGKKRLMLEYQAAKDLLQGKTILVTGAGAGIGKAAAIAFAKHAPP